MLKPSLRYYYGVCKNLRKWRICEISHTLEKESIRSVKYATQEGNYGFLQCCFFHGFYFFFLSFYFWENQFFFNHQGRSDTRVGIMVWSLELALHAWLLRPNLMPYWQGHYPYRNQWFFLFSQTKFIVFIEKKRRGAKNFDFFSSINYNYFIFLLNIQFYMLKNWGEKPPR